MRASLILLSMLIFLLANSHAQAAAPTRFSSPQMYGNYSLREGTDDCPHELSWQAMPKCDGGFQLQEINTSPKQRLTHSENFCNINKKSATSIQRASGNQKFKVQYTVEADNGLIKKHQIIEHSINNAPYTIELQASLILDQDGSFLYDRSLGQKGWSCLYKK